MTLAVGIVIDDAIIVLENIFRYMEEKGVGPIEAAIEGTKEIGLAVMATTLSLVIIFLPIAFMTGYARRYVNSFGWTMALSILVSMLVSFTLTPMMSSRFAEGRHEQRPRAFARIEICAVRSSEPISAPSTGLSITVAMIMAVCAAGFLFVDSSSQSGGTGLDPVRRSERTQHQRGFSRRPVA